MSEIERGKKLDFKLEDVQAVYEGPAGILWEMLMGEEIHVGGASETDILAEKAGISGETHVLDICSALGGPARHLAKKYGCRITGVDATKKMVAEAKKRTEQEGLESLIKYELGDSLNMPFENNTFDVVWGQDAWCYATDKKKLIAEAQRVMKPEGTIAFTDWIQTESMSETEWEKLNSFMVFPYMETMEGYEQLLIETGYDFIERENLSEDFAKHCHMYQDKLRNELKDGIIEQYGNELFKTADEGLALWVKAADEGKVGRGRWIGRRIK